MPEKPSSIVTGNPETADRLAVNVATSPASAMADLSTDSVTVGGASSSMISVVRCCVPDSVPLPTSVMWTVTDSLSSSRLSGREVTVVVPLVLPEAITICVPSRV